MLIALFLLACLISNIALKLTCPQGHSCYVQSFALLSILKSSLVIILESL